MGQQRRSVIKCSRCDQPSQYRVEDPYSSEWYGSCNDHSPHHKLMGQLNTFGSYPRIFEIETGNMVVYAPINSFFQHGKVERNKNKQKVKNNGTSNN